MEQQPGRALYTVVSAHHPRHPHHSDYHPHHNLEKEIVLIVLIFVLKLSELDGPEIGLCLCVLLSLYLPLCLVSTEKTQTRAHSTHTSHTS